MTAGRDQNADLSRLVQARLPAPPFVVFGASKSGTTWLQRCLDAHPEVRCHFQRVIFPLELKALAHPAVGVLNAGRSPFGGVFRSEIEERQYRLMLDLTSNLDVLQPRYLVGSPKSSEEKFHLAQRRRLARAVVEELLADVPSFSVYGTKAYTDLDALFAVFPEAKLIHILRDGRDVCVSKRFHMLRAGIRYLGDERVRLLGWLDRLGPTRRVVRRLQRHGFFGERWFVSPPADGTPLFNPHVLTKFAADWAYIVRYIEGRARGYPCNVLRVRYEEMLAEPHRALAEVFRFLGVNDDDETVAWVRAETDIKRLKKQAPSGASFFRKGEAGGWREHFRLGEAQLFQRVAGDVLIDTGYEKDESWVTTL